MSARSELEQSIAASPDDPARYLVYADLLQEEGDPRGELIRLQQQIAPSDATHRAQLRVALAQHFRTHRGALLGPLEEVSDAFELEWRWGFIRRARLHFRGKPRAPLATLSRLFASPSGRFLRELELGALGSPTATSRVVKDLSAAPATLQRLSLGSLPFPDVDPETVKVGALQALSALPSLEVLEVQSNHFDLSHLALPTLKALRVVASRFDSRWWVQLGALPATLERLELRLCGMRFEPSLVVNAIAHQPLTSLALTHAKGVDPLLSALGRTPLAESLTTLELSYSDLTSRGASKLAEKFPKLARLRLSRKAPGLEVPVEGPSLFDDGKPLRPRMLEALSDAAASIAGHRAAEAEAPLRELEPLVHALRRRSDLVRYEQQLAEVLKWSAQYPPAAEVLERVASRLEGVSDAELAKTFRLLATVQVDLGEREAALLYTDGALAVARAADDVESQVYGLEARAQLAVGAEGWARAKELYEEALVLAKRGFTRYVIHLEHMLANVRGQMGDASGARADFEKLLAAQKDPHERAKAMLNFGITLWSDHDWKGAEEAYRASLELSRQNKYERNEAFCLMNLGHLHVWRGRAPEAIEVLEPAIALFRKFGLASEVVGCLDLLADASLTANDVARAKTAATQALAEWKRLGQKTRTATALRILADLALNEWNAAEGARLAQEAIAVDKPQGAAAALFLAGSELKLGFARLIQGDAATADDIFRKAGKTYERLRFAHGWAEGLLGISFHAQGRLEEAESMLREAVTRAKAAGEIPGLRRTSAWVAAVLAAQKRLPEATRAIEDAARVGGDQPWDAQSIESLEVCRAFVRGDRSAARPIAYEARAQWELLHGWRV